MEINKTTKEIERHINKKIKFLRKKIKETKKRFCENKEKTTYEYYLQLLGRYLSYNEIKIDLKHWY